MHKIIVLIVVVCGIAAVVARDLWDRATNYAPTEARVVAVTDVCYMETRVGKTVTRSNLGNCALAERLVKEDPAWRGYNIYHKTRLTLAYTSPVDRKILTTEQTIEPLFQRNMPVVGDTRSIRISKSDPTKVLDG